MIPYQNIAKPVALKSLQMEGGDTAAREAAYAAAAISASMDGTELPPSALKAAILGVEKELATMIGNSSNALLRASLMEQEDDLVSGDEMPADDTFIGSIDGIFDATDNTPLTEQPKQVVLRRIENAGTFFKIPAYHFCIEGTLIFHTRTAVNIRGCVWDATVAGQQYDLNQNSFLPQELETLWIARVLASLPQENWFVPEAQFYAGVATELEEKIFGNQRGMMMNQPQIPVKTASADAVKD